YTFTVTNTGTVPLSTVTVTETGRATGTDGADDADGDSKLDTTETWVYTATWTVAATPDPLVNTATAMGYYGTTAYTDTDDHSLDVEMPGINVDKTGPASATVGEVVTYTITVTNTGTVPLSTVTVT